MRRRAVVVVGILGCWLAAIVPPAAAEDSPCWPPSETCAGIPNDPGFSRHWEYLSTFPPGVDLDRLHPAERALGSGGMSLDAAWRVTIGRDDVVIAVLDSGIRWDSRDLVEKIFLNTGELPVPQGAERHDANGDGLVDIRDFASDPRVGDRNGNGRVDAGDLVRAFSDCRDDDANGYPDDIAGWDFAGSGHCGLEGQDNDPGDVTNFGHGTGIASTAAASTNNGVDDIGVCPGCRVMPVRVGDSFVVDANRFASGTLFAARTGAAVVASALGSYNNTPAAREAIDFAWNQGVAVIASAADEFSYHHNYPSLYPHALYVNAIRYNDAADPARATTFWGLNPCTNFGARVSLSVPATSCSSGATARLAGVTGLVVSAARDAGHTPLHAEEIYQLLLSTTDDLDNSVPDWGGALYPARRGFDELSGYGRVHAGRVVAAASEGRIPPVVSLDGPDWFSIVVPRLAPKLALSGLVRATRAGRATWRLEYALGVEPRDADYRSIASGEAAPEVDGGLGTLDWASLPLQSGASPRGRDDRDRYSVTLRLSAVDARGLRAEARRSFFVFDDRSWLPHFPIELGASGEAGPILEDLDGDGRAEIVLPTAEGALRVLHWRPDGLRTTRVALGEGETVVRAAAVGDLRGNGKKSIVVATRDGKIHAVDPRGRPMRGFPVELPVDRSRDASPDQPIERGILSRPVLADLDGRPGLEIVVSALDGYLYVWRGDGKPLAGFPVAIARAGGPRAKLVSTPAVGDLDGDGRPEIVVGSNHLREGLGSAWAVSARGKLVAGWDPIELPALRGDLLPTLATGVAMEPALVDADGDGDLEALLYAVTGTEIALVDHVPGGPARVLSRFGLEPGERSALTDVTFLAETTSPLVVDADHDGTRELFVPLLPFRMLTMRSKPGVPIDVPLALGGWRVEPRGERLPMLPTWPRRMEDLMIFAKPAAADVDGDGETEILMGSGGYLLHAFRLAEGEAAGWPKFTGGWIFSAPASGDVDGDGRLEVVAVTREGWLFAWRPAPVASSPSPTTR